MTLAPVSAWGPGGRRRNTPCFCSGPHGQRRWSESFGAPHPITPGICTYRVLDCRQHSGLMAWGRRAVWLVATAGGVHDLPHAQGNARVRRMFRGQVVAVSVPCGRAACPLPRKPSRAWRLPNDKQRVGCGGGSGAVCAVSTNHASRCRMQRSRPGGRNLVPRCLNHNQGNHGMVAGAVLGSNVI